MERSLEVKQGDELNVKELKSASEMVVAVGGSEVLPSPNNLFLNGLGLCHFLK